MNFATILKEKSPWFLASLWHLWNLILHLLKQLERKGVLWIILFYFLLLIILNINYPLPCTEIIFMLETIKCKLAHLVSIGDKPTVLIGQLINHCILKFQLYYFIHLTSYVFIKSTKFIRTLS